MYDAVLRDPAFFLFLLRIDEELATETRRARCRHCTGALHVAGFPRKPRGCPASVVEEYSAQGRNQAVMPPCGTATVSLDRSRL